MEQSYESPWRIRLYKAASLWNGDAGNVAGDIWAPKELTVTLRWNRVSTAVVSVALGDPAVDALLADGTRIKIWRSGELVFTGTIDLLEVNGPSSFGQVRATFQSDWLVLHELISHPYGSGPTGNDPGFHYKNSGSAEAVVKDLISQNATKWGAGYVYVAPLNSPALGGTVSISTRFEELQAVLMPLVDQQDVGITAVHDGTRIVFDCAPVLPFTRVLDEASGIVANWSLSAASPSSTKVISGGSYQDTGSTTSKWTETVAVDSARVDTWGVRVNFQTPDAGQSGNTLDVVSAATTQAAQVGLKAGVAKNGISVQLSETGTFEYGQASGLLVGRRVSIDLEGVQRTDVLREVQFTYTADKGDKTVPVVGDIANDPDSNLHAFLNSVKKGIKRLEVKNS